MHNTYWLRDWMDAEDLRTFRQVQKALRSVDAVRRLKRRIVETEYTTEPLPQNTDAVVAGKSIDLSNDLECAAWKCKQRQVERLFSRVWHYFDSIVVVAAPAGPLHKVKDWRAPSLRQYLEEHARMLLYVRKIGAEGVLVFRQKPPACNDHLQDHLEDGGLKLDLVKLRSLTERLATEARVGTFVDDGEVHYYFEHPQFEHTVYGRVHDVDTALSNREFDVQIAERVVRRYVAHFAADVRARKFLERPLGTAIDFHGLLLTQAVARPPDVEADVALNLKLPVLDGANVRELLRMREGEKDAFIRFRVALRSAIKERVASAGRSNAAAIAREIDADVLEPAMADIGQRLKAARRVLAKKAALSISLGTLATGCGLITANPLLTTAGVGAAMSTLVAEGKYVEDTRDISLSDMYFLWKAKHLH